LPAIERQAVPMPQLLQALEAGIDQAGGRIGRRTGEGAPWTFVGRGDGVITAVDRVSRQGAIELAVAGRTVRIQTGPVVTGTAIRDALPFVRFNDYPDQLAFAEVGKALTERSLKPLDRQLAALRPGMHVSFVGPFNLARADDPILITPVAIAPVSPHGV
jgi:predicted lipoprotein